MSIAAPLSLYEATVEPEWLDWNDHLNVAYYVLAFDRATDEFYRFLGVAEDYIETRQLTMFALETHVTYQRELRRDDPIRATSQLLDRDAKRIHFIHHMYHATDDYLASTSEWIAIHVDLAARRAAPFPDDIAARVEALYEAHAGLPRPPETGRVIGIHQKKIRPQD